MTIGEMNHITQLTERYPALSVCEKDIRAAAEAMIASYENGGKLLVAGKFKGHRVRYEG